MLSHARISLCAALERDELTNLRRFDPSDLELLFDAFEEFVSDGNPDEYRALHSESEAFVDPLPGLRAHPDHIEVRLAMRRAAAAFNAGHAGVEFGMQIDLDESFGPEGSQSDMPRPSSLRHAMIDGQQVVEYAFALWTFDEDEPGPMAYDIEDVLEEACDDEDALIGLGVIDQEVVFSMVLSYRMEGVSSAS